MLCLLDKCKWRCFTDQTPYANIDDVTKSNTPTKRKQNSLDNETNNDDIVQLIRAFIMDFLSFTISNIPSLALNSYCFRLNILMATTMAASTAHGIGIRWQPWEPSPSFRSRPSDEPTTTIEQSIDVASSRAYTHTHIDGEYLSI